MTLGSCPLPSRRSRVDPAPASTFPPCFCTKAPAFGPYSFCQFVFFTSSCATIYAAMSLPPLRKAWFLPLWKSMGQAERSLHFFAVNSDLYRLNFHGVLTLSNYGRT